MTFMSLVKEIKMTRKPYVEGGLCWIPLDSSNVTAVTYDDEQQLLQVKFHTGSVYEYYDVPRTTYNNLLKAKSAGKYLNKHIRDKFDNQEVFSGTIS